MLWKRLYVLFACLHVSAKVEVFENFNQEVEKHYPANNSGTFKALRLDNGLEVMIHVTNEELPPKVALSVGVGFTQVSKNSPTLPDKPVEGLAHLVEHCLYYANDRFPVPYEFFSVVKNVGGHQNAMTKESDTTFEFISAVKFTEILERFAHLFINPHFIESSVKNEVKAINSEWSMKQHLELAIQCSIAQFMITKGHPGELFAIGNEESFDRPDILEQVKLFWKTHYTADNMKLAVSLPNTLNFKVVEDLIINLFSKIRRSDPETLSQTSLAATPSLPFWSVDHENEILKVYPLSMMRSTLYFYWHFTCEKGLRSCYDGLLLLGPSLTSSLSKFRNRDLKFQVSNYGPNDYVLILSMRLRDKDMERVETINEYVLNSINETIEKETYTLLNDAAVWNKPQNMAVSLARVMISSPSLVEAPQRACTTTVISESSRSLARSLLQSIPLQTPRLVMLMKSSYLKKINKNNSFDYDSQTGLWYKFEPFVTKPSETVDLFKSAAMFPSAASNIKLSISHTALPYTHQFIRGLFVEMLLIKLKENGITYIHSVQPQVIILQIFLTKPHAWKNIMNTVMGTFSSLLISSEFSFEKAKERQLRNAQTVLGSKPSQALLTDYAVILTRTIEDERLLLASDPNPVIASFKDVAAAGRVLQRLGKLDVLVTLSPSDSKFNADEMKKYIRRKWDSVYNYVSVGPRPVPTGHTVYYIPPALPTADNSLMILFPMNVKEDYVRLLTNILFPRFLEMLRHQMNLTYSPVVQSLYDKYLLFSIQSLVGPEIIQTAITFFISEAPEYIREMSQDDWNSIVMSSKLTEDVLKSVTKEQVINFVEEYLFESSAKCSRLIIQFYGRSSSEEREKYISNIQKEAKPKTELYTSIAEYPRSHVTPAFVHDDTLLTSFEVVERDLIPEEAEVPAEPEPTPPKNIFSRVWARIWA